MNRLLHIALCEGSTEANAQWKNPGSLFQDALMIRHSVLQGLVVFQWERRYVQEAKSTEGVSLI